MTVLERPYFCLTSDLDWASDYALSDFIDLLTPYKVRPTIFATHQSAVLTERFARKEIEIGLHPNYLSGSTHGNDIASVTDHVLGLFPAARAFRSHHFFHTSGVEMEMLKNNVFYDSNICLYLQSNIVPLKRFSGITSFPVFWEDDVHWLNMGSWEFEKYQDVFFSPGIKILNFHPFFVSTNIPDHEYYSKIKKFVQRASLDNINDIRYSGPGVRTFLIKMLEVITGLGHRFYTFNEICDMFPVERV